MEIYPHTIVGNRQYHLPLLIAVIFCSCIEEINFDAPEEIGVLVVDGELSTIADSNLLHLHRTGPVGLRVFNSEPDASIMIFDDLGHSQLYEQISPRRGIYCLTPDTVLIRAGGTYYLRIETTDGHVYESRPETILPVPEIDNIAFTTTIESSLVDETRTLERRYFNLLVRTTIPKDEGAPFLKWDVEQYYRFQQLCNGSSQTCYVNHQLNLNRVLISDTRLLEPGARYQEHIVRREVDFAFSALTSFYGSQKSLTEKAFEYWNNIQRTILDVGTVFDSPPSAIQGNMFSVSHPDEQVLGYFSAVDETRELLFIRSADLGLNYPVEPLCGTLERPATQFHNACCDCLRFLENSSYERPSYWP